MGHVNIRSLSTYFDEFKNFILSEKFDVYALSETWLHNDSNSNNFYIPGYELLRNDRHTGRGGAVGLYVRTNLLNNIEILNDININSPSLEQYWIKLSVGRVKLALGVIYRPPSSSCIDFIDYVETSISSIFSEVDHIICVGDVNINLLSLNNAVNLFSDLLDGFDLCQMISEPTRITANSETLIDVFITSSTEICSEMNLTDMHHVTDHRAISCRLRLECPHNRVLEFKSFRDFRNVNTDILLSSLNDFDWHYFYTCDDVNEKLIFFNRIIISLFDEYVPIRTIKSRYKTSPWITDVIKIMIKFRNNAYSQYKRTKSISHWNYYKMLRNTTTDAIRREKKAYFEFKIKNNSGGNIWKAIKEFNISARPNIDIPAHLTDVNLLNAHFINSIPSPQPDDSVLQFYKSHRLLSNDIYFSFSLVSPDEISKIFSSIKSNTSGADNINLNFLTLIFPNIVLQVTHIINECLLTNTFPDTWKQAIVKPIAKCKSPSTYNDLRPISILPTLSKILEKVVHYQIVCYLNKFEILPNIQSGFRKGYSTTTALQHIVDDIIIEIDKKRMVLLSLLDFSKAFDTLNHDLLLAKLHYIGFSNAGIQFIRSYLSKRSQAVAFNGISSEFVELDKGVPQGSILGPLLFSVYVFDLSTVVSFSKIHMYADDTQLYISFDSNDVVNAVQNVNKDLEAIAKYSSDNCLKLNESKSMIMLLGNEKTRKELLRSNLIKVFINNVKINISYSSKNLGLLLDCKLRFSEYVSLLIKKAFLALKNLYMNRFILSKQNRVILSSSLVLSVFNYCDTIYGPHITSFDIRRIQKVQNCCVRFIFGLRRRENVTSYIKKLGWLNMNETRMLHVACLAHRVIHNKSPCYLYKKLSVRNQHHQRNLRNILEYHIPAHNTALFKRTYSHVFPVILNKISTPLLNLQPATFANTLKKLLLSGTVSLN